MREREFHFGDGRDAREAPLLLFGRGKAELCEAGDRSPTELAQPLGRARGAVPRERLEGGDVPCGPVGDLGHVTTRSEEHTSELQSPCNLVCRLLLEKKKKKAPSVRPSRVED